MSDSSSSSNTLLPRIVYKKIVKMVDYYRKQDLEDYKENPDRLPTSWGSSLIYSGLQILRNNGVHGTNERLENILREVFDQLVVKGQLVRIFGDYGFKEPFNVEEK